MKSYEKSDLRSLFVFQSELFYIFVFYDRNFVSVLRSIVCLLGLRSIVGFRFFIFFAFLVFLGFFVVCFCRIVVFTDFRIGVGRLRCGFFGNKDAYHNDYGKNKSR